MIVVVGRGLAGVRTAGLISKKNEVIVFGDKKSNSWISGGAFRIKGVGNATLKESMLEAGKNNDVELLETFCNLTPFIELPIEKQEISFGWKVNMQKLIDKLEKEGDYEIEEKKVCGLMKNDYGVCGVVLDSGEEIKCDAVVLATGGFSAIFKNNDNVENADGSGIVAAESIGAKVKNMNDFMLHPFIHNHICIPTENIVNAEVFGKKGRILWVEKLLRERNAHHKLDEICETFFKEKEVRLVVEGKKIDVEPGVHTTLGGLVINNKCETNVNGLFALGECTTGLHGKKRLGGAALSACWVFSEVAAKTVNEYVPKHFASVKKTIKTFEGLEEVKEVMEKVYLKDKNELSTAKERIKELKKNYSDSSYVRLAELVLNEA